MTGQRLAALAPSDTVAVTETPVAIIVSVDGTYYLKCAKDSAFLPVVLIAGIVYPLRVKQIQNTTLPSGAVITGIYAG